MFIRGGSAPRSKPLPFHVPWDPFHMPSINKWYTYLVCDFASLLTAVNALSFHEESVTKIECFLDFISHKIHLLYLLGPFTDPNDRFPYPLLIYFN